MEEQIIAGAAAFELQVEDKAIPSSEKASFKAKVHDSASWLSLKFDSASIQRSCKAMARIRPNPLKIHG